MTTPRISIAALIYRSSRYARWLYDAVREFTPLVQSSEAEFYFIANDPEPQLVAFLQATQIPHYVNVNPQYTEEELFHLGYAQPEYLHRVYRGWNAAIAHAHGAQVVLLNSDMYPGPRWLENLLVHARPDRVLCSQLVERWHAAHNVFVGSIHGEFGTPDEFDKVGFVALAERLMADPYRAGRIGGGRGYMPCLFDREMVERAGGYPEGNLAGKSFKDVVDYGDRVLFRRLAAAGVAHLSVLDSIVYHVQEGEMSE